jgi:hypothetical protein
VGIRIKRREFLGRFLNKINREAVAEVWLLFAYN